MWDASKSPGDLITSSDWNDMVTDQKNHASRHSDGGSDELDAADLAGGSGTSGQVLQTDGTDTSWVTPSSETVKHISSDYTTSGETTILIDQLISSYSLSSASYTGTSISTQDSGVQGLAFNDDGTKMFEVGDSNDAIYEYSLSTAYDLNTASYTGTSFSTQSSGTYRGPVGLAFNNDGTKMFDISYGDDVIYEYGMSTAYDISTASYTGTSISTQGDPAGIVFNDTGTKMFELSDAVIYEYNLSTAYDLSTASYTGTNITLQDPSPQGLAFNNDGTKMFEVGINQDLIYEWSLSTAYDISTASYTGTNFSTQDDLPTGIAFSNDGTKMFTIGANSDLIYEYNSSGGTSKISLSSSDALNGKKIRIKDTTGNAGSNPVTIDTESSETIDGQSSAILNSDYEALTFQSDGSNWYIVSRMSGGTT